MSEYADLVFPRKSVSAKQITVNVKNGCWQCTSHTSNQDGYPQVREGGQLLLVARFLYERLIGAAIFEVCRHTCDNEWCVNPFHIVGGTHAENVADRVSRKRSAFGVNHGRSKLTPTVVRIIRNSSLSTAALARLYGVDPKSIAKARSGESWKHVV